MKWVKAIVEFFKSIPSVARLFEKWIDLKEKELPIKFDKHEERKPVREVDAKWDAERRDDKGRKRDQKRDQREERRNKRRERGK